MSLKSTLTSLRYNNNFQARTCSFQFYLLPKKFVDGKNFSNNLQKNEYLQIGFVGDGGGFGEKFFRPNLILDKYLKLCLPKVFFNLKPQEV